ncbi:ferredoxin, partial [Klebsiella pneumoniae]|uniref:ferredoxin n=1 Tax=Klebsiella pneumoniae TaxID=573 RepID=UPI003C6D6B2C
AVSAQPSSDETRTKALQALLSCPTASIHTDKPAKDILQVQNTFPLAIDDDLPGVYLCGYPMSPQHGNRRGKHPGARHQWRE